jgi:hypothetical protein
LKDTTPTVTLLPPPGQPEGVADGHHPLADLDAVGVAERDRGELALRLDLDERHVGARVLADDLRLEALAVGEGHAHLVGALDHVAVRQDVALVVDHEARAEARPARALAAAVVLGQRGLAVFVLLQAEEVAERVAIARQPHRLRGVDVDDPGVDRAGDVAEGLEPQGSVRSEPRRGRVDGAGRHRLGPAGLRRDERPHQGSGHRDRKKTSRSSACASSSNFQPPRRGHVLATQVRPVHACGFPRALQGLQEAAQ